jgi:hypothetical protein
MLNYILFWFALLSSAIYVEMRIDNWIYKKENTVFHNLIFGISITAWCGLYLLTHK